MDPKTLEQITALVFICVYILIIKFYKRKVAVIWAGVAAVFLIGAVTAGSALASINWDVLGIYVGMLFMAEALVVSRIPDYVAIWVTNRSRKVWTAMLLVCALTGLLSTFLENVACVLIVAPVVFAIAKRIKASPVPMIIGCAVCSNLEGVATLIGDPPSMLLAAHAGLRFTDFFFFHGRPSLFFAVQIGLLASLALLYLFFRRYTHDTHQVRQVAIRSMFPAISLFLMVFLLAVSSFFRNIKYSAGIICLFFGIACLFWLAKISREENKDIIRTVLDMDWGTAVFIVAVFIIVDALVRTGCVSDLAAVIGSFTSNSLFLSFVAITGISVVISAFVDNIPFIVAMLPLTQIVAENSGFSPYVLYFGLLIGASVGGNITPVGASANIVGVGLLKNRGFETTFWDFVKIGLPLTIVSVIASAAFIWLMFGI